VAAEDRWAFLFLAVYLLASTPALPETSREAAEVVAARHARTCYVEMVDGQLKCGGRPRRALAAARALLGPGRRGLPNQAPIGVDAETGKLIECRS
jgi:hypothetical protein